MAQLQAVRGTQDVLPDENRLFRRVQETARNVAAQYGYGEISTPIFEFSDVFKRTLGDTSDIVTKEMYTFEDKGGDSITLRPEGTAGVARAFISNGLAQHVPLKLFYQGPMFRYERPQKGRRRQFHQVGVEVLGIAEPLGDVEVISLGNHFLAELGISDQVTLEINSLGDSESRANYREKLVAYLSQFGDELSVDSRERLDRNPLRILDSKDDGDRVIVADAPMLKDHLNDDSRAFFDTVCDRLTTIGISYQVNPRLVRGLDYYCHTAFEFTTEALGAQGTVLAGGRYDGLIEQMGGRETAGTGWAAGIERLSMLIGEGAPEARPIAVIPIGENAEVPALQLTDRLRHAGYTVDLGYSGNLNRRMKRANRLNARVAILLGEDELSRSVGMLRDMENGDQTEVPLEDVEKALADFQEIRGG